MGTLTRVNTDVTLEQGGAVKGLATIVAREHVLFPPPYYRCTSCSSYPRGGQAGTRANCSFCLCGSQTLNSIGQTPWMFYCHMGSVRLGSQHFHREGTWRFEGGQYCCCSSSLLFLLLVGKRLQARDCNVQEAVFC